MNLDTTSRSSPGHRGEQLRLLIDGAEDAMLSSLRRTARWPVGTRGFADFGLERGRNCQPAFFKILPAAGGRRQPGGNSHPGTTAKAGLRRGRLAGAQGWFPILGERGSFYPCVMKPARCEFAAITRDRTRLYLYQQTREAKPRPASSIPRWTASSVWTGSNGSPW